MFLVRFPSLPVPAVKEIKPPVPLPFNLRLDTKEEWCIVEDAIEYWIYILEKDLDGGDALEGPKEFSWTVDAEDASRRLLARLRGE